LAGPLPDLAIRTRGPLDAVVRVPGSKSITNRAVLIAALARGDSTLAGCLESDDTQAMREALRALGVAIEVDGETWQVHGANGVLRAPAAPLDARASGTTARFLTAAATLADGPVGIDGTPRMRERPIDDLTDCLVALGAKLEVLGQRGCPPVRLHGGGLAGGRAPIDARRSSQFVSAVLLAAPYARADVVLAFTDGSLVSKPYVDLTLDVMRAFGAARGCRADRSTSMRVATTPAAPGRSSATRPPPPIRSAPPRSPAAACASRACRPARCSPTSASWTCWSAWAAASRAKPRP
jgi:3-phosphoshikimate 1-carboxyvinyltransferase